MPIGYLTTVSAMCLALCYLAVMGALAALPGVDEHARAGLTASLLGLAAIAAPMWLLHWYWLREAWDGARTATANGRRRYLHLTVALGLVACLASGWRAATDLAALILGVPVSSGASVVMFAFSASLWLYHVHILGMYDAAARRAPEPRRHRQPSLLPPGQGKVSRAQHL